MMFAFHLARFMQRKRLLWWSLYRRQNRLMRQSNTMLEYEKYVDKRHYFISLYWRCKL